MRIEVKTFKKILLFLFFSLVVISVLAYTESGKNEVEAQNAPLITGSGSTCRRNVASCPDGYTNISRAQLSFNGLTRGEFEKSIVETYQGYSVEDLCIRDDLTEIVEIIEQYTVYPGDPEREIRNGRQSYTAHQNSQLKYYDRQATTGADGEVVWYPTACSSGWSAQKAPNDFSVIGDLVDYDEPYGCCPSGYYFKNITGQSSPSAFQAGICCSTQSAKEWKGPDNEDGACFDENSQPVDAKQDFDIFPFSSPDEVVSSIPDSRLESIQQLYPVENILDQRDGWSARFPQYGLGLGQSVSAVWDGEDDSVDPNIRIYIGKRTGSQLVCGNMNGCAVIQVNSEDSGSENGQGFSTIGIENGSGFEIVDAASLTEEDNLKCVRCFNSGEAVAEDINGNVVICGVATANPGIVDNPDQITNLCERGDLTISQALAVCQNPSAADSAVQRKCLEQGGIYIAIGCIDPSPLGLITGLIRISLGVVGGVALVQLIIAGLAYQSGNQEQIEKAQSRIFSTIGGLAVLIFSVLILRIIGVNILDVVPEGLF